MVIDERRMIMAIPTNASITDMIIKQLETMTKIQGDIIDKLIKQRWEINTLTEKNAGLEFKIERLECELTTLKKQMEVKV